MKNETINRLKKHNKNITDKEIEILHTCQRCKAHCCIGEYATFITFRDAIRISKHTGMDIEEFCCYEPICSDTLGQHELMKEKDHVYFEFSDDGWVLQLKSEQDGACIFLDNMNRCRIYKSWPLICRIVPIWFRRIKTKDDKEEIELFVDENDADCHWNKDLEVDATLKNMGQTKEEMIRITRQFSDEIKEYIRLKKHLKDGMSPKEVIKRFLS